jgi:cell shape-determining protein MreD
MAVTVTVQFIMELTLGRVFFAPALVPFMLVYFSENFEGYWAVDGAFWSGLVLDLLLHQPVGCSSIALLLGMYVAGLFRSISSSEGRGYLLGMTMIATLVSDTVFILLASRPIGSGLGKQLLAVLPRLAVTTLFSAAILSAIAWTSSMRSRMVRR